MKTPDQLRSERRIGVIVSIVLVSGLLATWLSFRFVAGFLRVPVSSMEPTIHKNDRVSIYRAAYWFGRKPRVGDVASYWASGRRLHLHRIVGGPGDTLEMKDNALFRNGTRVDEPYILLTPDVPALRSFGPVQVPPGHYFFLGDNRDNANDSRFLGFTAEEQIRGRMAYVLHIGECNQP